MSIRDKLIEFHKAMDIPVLDRPQVPADERVRLRAALVVEEVLELLEACFHAPASLEEAKRDLHGIIRTSKIEVDLIEVADALADIIYVAEGMNLEFGINGKEVFDEVHRSNMAKAGGGKHPNGKIKKPDGWTPPDVAGVLKRQREAKQGTCSKVWTSTKISL